MDAVDLREKMMAAGRRYSEIAWLASDAFDDGLLTPDALIYAWASLSDGPQRHLETEWWVEMFSSFGFITDSQMARPVAPVTLYRASLPEYARNMSWTTLEQAKGFAIGPGRLVYKATFEPGKILAYIDDYAEGEYVVDARNADAVPVWKRGPAQLSIVYIQPLYQITSRSGFLVTVNPKSVNSSAVHESHAKRSAMT